jgi:hypothetical protein
MKGKILTTVVACLVGSAHAQWTFDNSLDRPFDMKKNLTNKTLVTVKYFPAKKVQEACDAQSRAYGYSGMGGPVIACSWYWEDHCVIIVPELAEMRTIGHEFMHCLQNHWHD